MAIDKNADFTPSIPDSGAVPTKLPYNHTGSFKFWAQKVIPLVYDDSLSYYEVLCKVVTYLNNVIQNIDNLNDSVNNTNQSFETLKEYVNATKDTLISTYNELQDYVNTYFDNLDVQNEINAKLDAMADSGELTNLLAPFIPDLVTQWLNTHVTPTSPVIDNTLSISGAGADAKVTGDKLSDLNNALDANNKEDIYITNGSTSDVGITCSADGNRVKVYGTATANRFLLVFNTTWRLIGSVTNPGKAFIPGTYKLNLNVSGHASSVEAYWTKAYYKDADIKQITDGSFILGDEQFSSALFFKNNVDYGTENDPTYIDISLTRYDAKIGELKSTNNNQDRKSEILFCLNKYGICRLGEGTFFVGSTITMPDGSALIGSGYGTNLQLSDTAPNICITMGSNCTVENCSISGGSADISLTGELTDRTGIFLRNDVQGIKSGTINNCFIHRFNGAGISLINTGGAVDSNLKISNCLIENCECGILIRNSEYHKIVNCTIVKNYYGCINRGGNNNISNCGFDENYIGIQVDNAAGSNQGHGIISGCTINHSNFNDNENIGYGLVIKGAEQMLVVNNNFYYSKILLDTTNGNVITNCGFGTGSVIEIDAKLGNCNIVSNNMFPDENSISTISGYTKSYNNYTRNGLIVKNSNYSSDVIQNIAKSTDNLMPYGDLEFTGTILLPLYKELEPGTYTLSATVITEGNTYAAFRLLSTIYTQDTVYNGGIRTLRKDSVTFEISETAKFIYLYSGGAESSSTGKKVIYKELQIESGNHSESYAPFYSFEDSRLNGINLDDVKVYLDFEPGYIDTSSDTVNVNNPVSHSAFSHIVIDCSAGDEFSFEAKGGNASRKLFAFCDDQWNIIYSSYATAESSTTAIPMDLLVYSAPINAKHLIVNHHHVKEAGFNPKVYKLSKNTMTNYIARNYYHKLPYIQDSDWKNKVISTYKNMIAIKDGNKICLSLDCGKTWNSGVDVTGVSSIVNSHLYSNGTLAFFTEQEAFYISDWTSYHTATCYEKDGTTVYTPGESDNFNALWHHEERKFINGNDMYVFSNYNLTGSRVRNIIWYSIDNGQTYKIAYEFNVTGAEPVTHDEYTIRHIHDVLYWDTYDKFIVTTGDRNATECMVFELTYNSEDDSWDITKLGGSSRQYKWANIELFNEELYYCQDNTPGSIWKCKYQDIGDLSKHTCILNGMNDDALSICFGKRGDMIVVQSTSRNLGGEDVPSPFTPYEACRKIYYSSDRKSFIEIFVPPAFINDSSMYCHNHPITTDGHCFLGIYQSENLLPSICVDDYIRSFGYRQAFMGEL